MGGESRSGGARRCATTLLVLCLSSVPAWAQRDVDAYRSLVEAYRSAAPITAVQLNVLTAGDLLEQVDAVVAPTSGWDWPALRAAAVLHTEHWYRMTADRRFGLADRQLEAAVRLLARVWQLEPGQTFFVERWETLVAGLLRAAGKPRDSDRIVSRTTEVLRRSPARRQALRELAAGLEVEREAAGRPLTLTEQRELRPEWHAAARWYEGALGLDPSLTSASLHLGRIRMLQGELDAAAQRFASVAASDDPRVRYLSALFTGSIAERLGDVVAAEQHYRRAMATYPHGQAAWLALSQLHSRTGRDAEARAMIAALGQRAGAVVEPLWTYLPAGPRVFDVLLWLDELRAEARQ